jgi:hypothetical protein
MEQRELLRAMARFLADYCGEEALQRWQEKLSDIERQQLARAPSSIREASGRLVEGLRQVLRALAGTLTRLLRACAEAAVAAWSTLSGAANESFGPQMP